ncbi:hypothetical protein ACDQ55_20695 [Chitinophaga sp. 30R24]|uniref:hypothetical protein n=1 Tax=Chitinophaga sp. 30R24 TaxID=3248838 RepID=UPI003B917FAD
MPLRDHTIGGQHKQGGPDLDNDYRQDIRQEVTSDDIPEDMAPEDDSAISNEDAPEGLDSQGDDDIQEENDVTAKDPEEK